MSFWSRFHCFNHVFYSSKSSGECKNILSQSEVTYGDRLNPGMVLSERLDDGQYLLTFIGHRFGKARRTEYIAEISDVSGGCKVLLNFHRELLGMPPMTPVQEIGRYMEEKFNATHQHTT